MKKLFVTLVATFVMCSLTAQNIKLPEPETEGGKPFYNVLKDRQTNRNFSDTPLEKQELSNLLWCANGINRPDGKRTAPSARNCQEIDIYVLTKNGIYLYEPKEYVLLQLSRKDIRKNVSKRCEFTADAPVVLVYVANYDKMKGFDKDAREFYGATDCGFVSQNVYLYCASVGLNTVVLGAIEREDLRSILKIENGKVVLAQPVGYPAK